MSNVATAPPQPDTALAEALSDLVRAGSMDLPDVLDAPAARDDLDALLVRAKRLSPADKAYLLSEIARTCGLVNIERAALRVAWLHCASAQV